MLLQTGNTYVPLEDGEAVKWESFGSVNYSMEETHPPAQNLYHRSMWMRSKLALFFSIFIGIHLMVFNIQMFSRYSELTELILFFKFIFKTNSFLKTQNIFKHTEKCQKSTKIPVSFSSGSFNYQHLPVVCFPRPPYGCIHMYTHHTYM